MLKIDARQIDRMERKLDSIRRQAVPYAVRNTLNDMAFKAQRVSRDFVGREMIERNKWTRRSIGVHRAQIGRVHDMQSEIGSTEAYMLDQEEGATHVKGGKHGVVIPTSTASGEGEGRPRRRVVRKANRMQNISLRARRGANRKQRNIIAVKQAAAGKGSRYVFMDLGRRKGIFRVYGRKKSPRVRMVHDLSKPSVVIPRRPWLTTGREAGIRRAPVAYFARLGQQLKRIR